MGYKRWTKNMSFGEMALTRSLEKNRSLKTMERINKIVDLEESRRATDGLLHDWSQGRRC